MNSSYKNYANIEKKSNVQGGSISTIQKEFLMAYNSMAPAPVYCGLVNLAHHLR